MTVLMSGAVWLAVVACALTVIAIVRILRTGLASADSTPARSATGGHRASCRVG